MSQDLFQQLFLIKTVICDVCSFEKCPDIILSIILPIIRTDCSATKVFVSECNFIIIISYNTYLNILFCSKVALTKLKSVKLQSIAFSSKLLSLKWLQRLYSHRKCIFSYFRMQCLFFLCLFSILILTLSPFLWLRKILATSSFTKSDAERGQLSRRSERREPIRTKAPPTSSSVGRVRSGSSRCSDPDPAEAPVRIQPLLGPRSGRGSDPDPATAQSLIPPAALYVLSCFAKCEVYIFSKYMNGHCCVIIYLYVFCNICYIILNICIFSVEDSINLNKITALILKIPYVRK